MINWKTRRIVFSDVLINNHIARKRYHEAGRHTLILTLQRPSTSSIVPAR